MGKVITLFILSCNLAYAGVLPQNAPERAQLIAMGYDIVKEEKGDFFTIAELGTTKIAFDKDDERLAVSRFFNIERKLNNDEQAELMKILNKFNADFTYQFSVNKQTITATIYNFGNYDSRTFAKLVRIIDKVNNVFDTEPRFFKLVNN